MVNIRSKFMKAIGVVLSAGCVTSSVCVKAMRFLTDNFKGIFEALLQNDGSKKRDNQMLLLKLILRNQIGGIRYL